MMKKWCWSLLLLIVTSGCYNYRAVESPQPGMEVRARLSTEAAVRRSRGLDAPVMHVDGRVVDAVPQSIMLDVLVARDASQFRDVEIRDTLRIDRTEIESITVRELSTGRSLLFAGAVGAGAYLVVRGITTVVGGNEGDDGDDGGTVFAIPVVSFPLPFR